MREREVIRTVAERLRAEGLMDLKVRYGSEPGPDIEGTLPRSRRHLFVEAKGERARTSPRITVGEALLQILSRWDSDVVCALAVPYNKEFEEVLRTILPGLRCLELHVLLAKDGEVWYLSPNKAGFLVEKPLSIIEVLER